MYVGEMKIFQPLLYSLHGEKKFLVRLSRCNFSTKKDMSLPIATAYNPKDVESKWNAFWEENHFFRKHDAQEKFVMLLPPPNITGSLHLGHALTCSIQDALARWHQMNGKKVVWVPGCDHAGIATQVVVERHLWATQQTTRHQLGREKFIKEIMNWKDQKGTQIYDQMKQLGVSLDWDRAVYTMDDHMCESVSEAFIKLFNSGLVYRKSSLVNWCFELQSAISNIEVEHHEVEGTTLLDVPGYEDPVTFGKLYDFAYKVCDSGEELVVSTTRPETMLGDTAVMVHPEDSRYVHLLGKQVVHPFRKDTIPVIADVQVNPEFGTGAVKVTPAHSTHDFEVGINHNLQQLTIFDEQGKVNMSEFKGQPRFKARDSILTALHQLGLYRGCKSHAMAIPRCSRTGDVIEPLLKPQWFLNVKEMASKAVSAVQDGNLKIYPPGYKGTWNEWLAKNIHDWCLSRQLWWGHRIPAYCIEVNDAQNESWVAAMSEEEARKKFVSETGIPEAKIKSIKQEEDTLDTWFSSGLLPFAVFGWPQNSNDLSQLYPTTLLETGHDILFFWVARMVMLGLQLTGELPFKTVLLHGLMRDAQGRKMSKSRGNVIDPMDVINGASLEVLQGRIKENEKNGVLSKNDAVEALKYQTKCFPKGIPECGADALRFSLCSYSVENQYVSVDVNRMEQHRFLCNKIWQVMRFLLSAFEGLGNDRKYCSPIQFTQKDNLQVMDRWILSHLSHLVFNTQKYFASFKLHHVVAQFEAFWYNCLCGVYLESIKPALKSEEKAAKLVAFKTLWSCVDVSLQLLSPFMPFLTEELYQRLPRLAEKHASISQCHYPQPDEWKCWRDKALEETVGTLLEVTTAICSLKAAYNIDSRHHKSLQGSLITSDENLQSFLKEAKLTVQTLARIGSFSVIEPSNKPPAACAVSTISNTTTVYLHLEGMVDPKREIERLNKKLQKLKKKENSLIKQMSWTHYEQKTPVHKQKSHNDTLTAFRKEIEQVTSLISTLEEM